MEKVIQDEKWYDTFRKVLGDTSGDSKWAAYVADRDAAERQQGLKPLKEDLSCR